MNNISIDFSKSGELHIDKLSYADGEESLYIRSNNDAVEITLSKDQLNALKIIVSVVDGYKSESVYSDNEDDFDCEELEDFYDEDLEDMGDYDLNNDEYEDEYVHLVNRDWQRRFVEYLHDMGFDGYGYAKTEELDEKFIMVESSINDHTRKFENDVFSIMPFYWGGDDNIPDLPNFHYKPTGFKLQWYKYALRGSYMNQVVSWDELEKMLQHCKESMEDLNVKGMMKNRHLSKSVANQKFYEFRNKLEMKCKMYGIELRIVDRFYPSSKLCSCCGFKKTDLKLSDRTYECSNCKTVIDRDLNASLNLKQAREYKVS